MVKITGHGTDLFKIFKLASDACEYVTKTFFTSPNKLDMEAIYYPFMIFKKKNYAGVKYKKPNDPEPQRFEKGLKSIRRDNCQLLRDCMKKMLDAILLERSKEKAIQICIDTVQSMIQDKFQLDDFIITQELSKDATEYTAKNPPQHVSVVLKKMSRNQRYEASGERVAYAMFLQPNGSFWPKGSLKGSAADDPEYGFKEMKWKLDYSYYFHNQLEKSVDELLFSPGIFAKSCNTILDKWVREMDANTTRHAKEYFFKQFESNSKRQSEKRKRQELAAITASKADHGTTMDIDTLDMSTNILEVKSPIMKTKTINSGKIHTAAKKDTPGSKSKKRKQQQERVLFSETNQSIQNMFAKSKVTKTAIA